MLPFINFTATIPAVITTKTTASPTDKADVYLNESSTSTKNENSFSANILERVQLQCLISFNRNVLSTENLQPCTSTKQLNIVNIFIAHRNKSLSKQSYKGPFSKDCCEVVMAVQGPCVLCQTEKTTSLNK